MYIEKIKSDAAYCWLCSMGTVSLPPLRTPGKAGVPGLLIISQCFSSHLLQNRICCTLQKCNFRSTLIHSLVRSLHSWKIVHAVNRHTLEPTHFFFVIFVRLVTLKINRIRGYIAKECWVQAFLRWIMQNDLSELMSNSSPPNTQLHKFISFMF